MRRLLRQPPQVMKWWSASHTKGSEQFLECGFWVRHATSEEAHTEFLDCAMHLGCEVFPQCALIESRSTVGRVVDCTDHNCGRIIRVPSPDFHDVICVTATSPASQTFHCRVGPRIRRDCTRNQLETTGAPFLCCTHQGASKCTWLFAWEAVGADDTDAG